MKYLLLAVLAVSFHSNAQQVYKCVNGKDVSYQSQPCPDSHKAQKQWEATPEPPPTNQQLWDAYYAKKKGERESAELRARANQPSNGSPIGANVRQQTSTCEQAREDRRRYFDAHPNRTFTASRILDDAVTRACK